MEKLKLLLLVLLLNCFETQCQQPLAATEPTMLPNIDFLGSGYDVFRGNPRSRSRDPGFKTEKILALNYKNKSISDCGNWIIPDNVEVSQDIAWSTDSNIIEVLGSNC